LPPPQFILIIVSCPFASFLLSIGYQFQHDAIPSLLCLFMILSLLNTHPQSLPTPFITAKQTQLDMLWRRDYIITIMRTIVTLHLFANYTGAALVLAQDITYTSTLTLPVLKCLTRLPTTTTSPVSPRMLTATMQRIPTTIVGLYQTPLPTSISSPTPSTTTTEPTCHPDIEMSTHSTSRHPLWIQPATISLLCYDFVVIAAFAWCWVMGWFWWWKKIDRRDVQRVRETEEWRRRLVVNEEFEREMRRLGMV
jgi:hypothetical protein